MNTAEKDKIVARLMNTSVTDMQTDLRHYTNPVLLCDLLVACHAAGQTSRGGAETHRQADQGRDLTDTTAPAMGPFPLQSGKLRQDCAMLTLHIIAAVIITLCIRRLRREIRKASGFAKLWLERCISLEAENAHLRRIICRFERGELVPEGEIDDIMARLRKVGLIRPPTTSEKGHDNNSTA